MSVRIACRRSSALCVLFMWLLTAHSRASGVEARQPLQAWLVSGALSALRDPDDQVKAFALRRLGELKEPRTAETIAEFLKTKYSSSVRLAALEAYAALHIRERKHLPEIAAYLVSTSSPSASEAEQIGAAVEAISAMGAEREYKSQIAQLIHPSAVLPINSGVLLGLAKGGSLREYRPQVLALFEVDGGAASQAVEASGLGGDYRPQLQAILKSQVSVRGAFTWKGLPASEAQQAQAFIHSYYTSKEQLARRAAWHAIFSAHLGRSFLPQIQHALTSGLHQGTSDGEELAGAISAVVSEDLDQTYAASIHRALDRHSKQRFLAIAALASAGAAARYGWEIKQALPFTPWDSASDRAKAIEAIAATGLPLFRQFLADILSGRDSFYKSSALQGIAQAGTVGQYMQEIGSLAKSKEEAEYGPIREGILDALASGQCDLDYMLTLVEPLTDTAPWEVPHYRLTLYSCGGGGKDATLAAALLPRGARHNIGEIISRRDDRRRAFALFEHLATLPGMPYQL